MQQRGDSSPFTAVVIALVVMLGFAAFFVTFLLAPLLIVAVGYLMLRATERSSGGGSREQAQPGATTLERNARLDRERQVRRRALRNGNGTLPQVPAEAEAGPPPPRTIAA